MKAIMTKTIKSYFSSSFGYIFIGVFFLLSAINFVPVLIQRLMDVQMSAQNNIDIQNLFLSMANGAFFLMPLLAIGLWSQEKSKGTDKLLLTSPVSSCSIITGKYLGALIFSLIPILSTLLIVVLTAFLGKISILPILFSYIAFILLTSFSIAIGLFFSSLTDKTENAALGAVGLMIFLGSLEIFKSMPNIPKYISVVTDFLSVQRNYSEMFTSSALFTAFLNPAPIVYFLSLTALFLFGASIAVKCKNSK